MLTRSFAAIFSLAAGLGGTASFDADPSPRDAGSPSSPPVAGLRPDEAKPDEAKPDEAKPDEAKPDVPSPKLGDAPAANAIATAPAGFARVRPPLFGLAVDVDIAANVARLVRITRSKDGEETSAVLLEGDRAACEKELVRRLVATYGTGRPNFDFVTLGGMQFWSDEVVYRGWRVQQNTITGHHRLLDPDDVRRAWGDFRECRVALEREIVERGLAPTSPHLVLVVHGLFRSKHSMRKLADAIEEAGFDVESVNYPSTRQSIAEHADQLEDVVASVHGYRTVSFVTHSLGGIVVRELLGRDSRWKSRLEPRRLVQIAPPNRGSLVAEFLEDFGPYRALAGRSGIDLTPAGVARVPAPTCEFAVIAGGRGDGEGYNPFLPGDDDGTVCVASTRLDGAADFILVDELHSFLMGHEETIAATVNFLRHGHFEPATEESTTETPPEPSETSETSETSEIERAWPHDRR